MAGQGGSATRAVRPTSSSVHRNNQDRAALAAYSWPLCLSAFILARALSNSCFFPWALFPRPLSPMPAPPRRQIFDVIAATDYISFPPHSADTRDCEPLRRAQLSSHHYRLQSAKLPRRTSQPAGPPPPPIAWRNDRRYSHAMDDLYTVRAAVRSALRCSQSVPSEGQSQPGRHAAEHACGLAPW